MGHTFETMLSVWFISHVCDISYSLLKKNMWPLCKTCSVMLSIYCIQISIITVTWTVTLSCVWELDIFKRWLYFYKMLVIWLWKWMMTFVFKNLGYVIKLIILKMSWRIICCASLSIFSVYLVYPDWCVNYIIYDLQTMEHFKNVERFLENK